MNWLTVLWSIPMSACLVLALIHLFVWVRDRRRWLHLLFASAALGAAGMGFVELVLLHAASVDQYLLLIRWGHVPLFVLLVSIVWFVYLRSGTARRWLAVLITALWCVSLAINFAAPYSLTFEHISGLRQGWLWGQSFTMADGEANPWQGITNAASLLVVVFVADASLTLWRRGTRRRALLIGGSVALFTLAAGVHTPLVDAGWVETPYMISFSFLAIIVAMSYELGTDVLQASLLSRQIEADENRWRSLLENVQLLVLGLDVDGRVTYANPYFVSTIGYDEKDLLGKPLALFVSPNGMEDGRFGRPTETPASPRVERRFVTRAGGERIALWSGVTLRDADDRWTGSLSIGIDVTEQRAAEERLGEAQREALELQAELAHVGRLRTMGELVAALAHELNQPLAAIMSNAQAAQRFLNASPPDLHEVAEILRDVVADDARAAEVIRRLRSFLRKGDLQREPVDVGEIVREVANLLRGKAEMNAIAIELSVEAGLPSMSADRIQLQQVLVNLVSNATEAMITAESPRRSITISAARDASDGVAISVRDSGPGLSAEQLERSFEPFFTTKRHGLGFGLSLCRTIVEAHGGRLSASSEPGGGATFRFTLPSATPEGGETGAEPCRVPA